MESAVSQAIRRPLRGLGAGGTAYPGLAALTLGYIPSPPPEAKNTNKNENIGFTALHGIQPIEV